MAGFGLRISDLLSYLLGLSVFQVTLAVPIFGSYLNSFQLMTLIVAFRLLYMPRIVVIIPFLLIVLISVPMLFVAVLVDLNNSTILYFNRVEAYVMLFLPMVAFPLLIFRRKLIANDILLGVKHSGFLMIILGCFQIIFFNVYGVDVFPYGYFYGSESRAAIFLSSGKEGVSSDSTIWRAKNIWYVSSAVLSNI